LAGVLFLQKGRLGGIVVGIRETENRRRKKGIRVSGNQGAGYQFIRVSGWEKRAGLKPAPTITAEGGCATHKITGWKPVLYAKPKKYPFIYMRMKGKETIL